MEILEIPKPRAWRKELKLKKLLAESML